MAKPLHVLIVEDQEDDAQLMVRVLAKGGYAPLFERVDTAEALRKALREKPWDLVLCDYSLPQFNALDALALLKEEGLDLPFILVSGAIGEETAVATMKAGAHDYIMKDKLQRLPPAVEREIREAIVRRERARAQAALLASDEKFSRIFANSPVAMAITVIEDGLIMDVNDAYLHLTEYTRDELLGRSTTELNLWFNPDDRKRILKALNRERRIQGFPVSVRAKSGKIVPVLFSAELVNVGGTPSLLTTAIDISERMRAEEKYRTLVENAPVGIFQVTPPGRVLTANRAMAQILGYGTPEEMIATVTDVARQLYLRPEDRTGLLGRVDERERLTGQELQWRRKDGRTIWVSVNIAAIGDGRGAPLYYEGIAEDITARKAAEAGRQESTLRLRRTLEATILAMAVVVETRDPYTAGHQRRTAELSAAIAAEMGLEPSQIEGIRLAGLIHDLGKIAVPAEILSKPSRLSALEFSLIKVHSQAGYDILKEIDFPWPVARMILEHHERMDGSGYPRGLRAQEMLPESRIIQVADVVESMASHRPYRPARGIDAALDEITRNRGVLYDGAVVDHCLRLIREKNFQWQGA
jgi:PAS domain S-box-containing protein